MSSTPKPSTKFSLSDLKKNMVKKGKGEESPVTKSVHTPTTRASKRKKSADSVINLEIFEGLSADETKDKLFLGVNHLVQLLKKQDDELLEVRKRCLELKKTVAEKEAVYKGQEEALRKEIVDMAKKVEEEKRLMVEEAQNSATTSVVEAMYEMAKEAAAAGFSLPSWDLKGWAQMLGKLEDVEQLGDKIGNDAEQDAGVGEEQGAGGSGDGLLMGNEDDLNV